jgi:hypothetical protein
MLSLVLVVNAKLSTTDTDAARPSPTIAYTPITSLSCAMVVRPSMSLTVVVYALPTMSSRRWPLEQSGLSH